MSNNDGLEKPTFIYREEMTSNTEYIDWLREIKQRYRKSQTKAAVRVNSAMLEFYWSVGRDLVRMRAEQKWGSGVVKQFSLDMREAFPNERGFSYTNVKDIKRWYLFYYEQVTKSHQAGGLLGNEKSHQVGGFLKSDNDRQLANSIESTDKDLQAVGFLEMPVIFGNVPWKHHVHIVSKSKSLNEALFYVNKVVEEGWSRSMLEDKMADHLFEKQGSAITNFDTTLPAPDSKLAKELLKSEYNLSFISSKDVEEEKDLEDALARNVTKFLLELGKGFAYVGRQMELQMPGGQSFFPDLVFYHIPRKLYLVVELKVVEYMPEFAGKLNFYVNAANQLLKGDGDNPSIGLIICKSLDKTLVEWSLKGIETPLGVATYQLQEVVERTIIEYELDKKKQ